MSSLPRKTKRAKYTKKVNGRVIKIDRPSKTHESTLPIKDEKQLEKLIRHCEYRIKVAKGEFQQYLANRDYIMVILGLNTALRAEDLLQLKVKDITRGRVWITENKTQKQQDFFLSAPVREVVTRYIAQYDLTHNEYLFQSRRTGNSETGRPISRAQAFKIMKELGHYIGIDYSFGLHSLRKTFGYQYIKHAENQWSAFLNLQRMYNHSTIAVTQLYICWDKDDVEKSRENISIGIKGKNETRASNSVSSRKKQYSKNKKQ